MSLPILLAAVVSLGSLDTWEREATSRNATGEFFLSTKGAELREAIRGMKGKLSIARHGMLRVDKVVDAEACEAMLKKVNEVRPRAERGTNHHNIAVDMDPVVQGVYLSVIDKAYRLIKDLVTDGGLLVAMGIMVNDPGARYQKWHADTIPTPRAAKLYTFFVALEDVTEDMGPTGLIGGSHRKEFIDECDAEIKRTKHAPCQELIDSSPKFAATLKQGDVFVMDSTIQHRANANTSDKRRRYFYFSMTGPGERPTGSTYTLLESYKKARLTLRNYRRWSKIPAQ